MAVAKTNIPAALWYNNNDLHFLNVYRNHKKGQIISKITILNAVAVHALETFAAVIFIIMKNDSKSWKSIAPSYELSKTAIYALFYFESAMKLMRDRELDALQKAAGTVISFQELASMQLYSLNEEELSTAKKSLFNPLSDLYKRVAALKDFTFRDETHIKTLENQISYLQSSLFPTSCVLTHDNAGMLLPYAILPDHFVRNLLSKLDNEMEEQVSNWMKSKGAKAIFCKDQMKLAIDDLFKIYYTKDDSSSDFESPKMGKGQISKIQKYAEFIYYTPYEGVKNYINCVCAQWKEDLNKYNEFDQATLDDLASLFNLMEIKDWESYWLVASLKSSKKNREFSSSEINILISLPEESLRCIALKLFPYCIVKTNSSLKQRAAVAVIKNICINHPDITLIMIAMAIKKGLFNIEEVKSIFFKFSNNILKIECLKFLTRFKNLNHNCFKEYLQEQLTTIKESECNVSLRQACVNTNFSML